MSGDVDNTSFASLLILSGVGTIHAGGEMLEVKKGDSIFVEAGTGEFEVMGELEMLVTRV